jgi:hypothetical protein
MARSKNETGAQLSLSSSARAEAGSARAPREEPIAAHLDANDVAELRAALARSRREGEVHTSHQADIDADLRKALRVACDKARRQRVRAEHLLIDLKTVWVTLPRMLSTRSEERLNRIVSACIDEYYAPGSSTRI